MTCYYHEPHNLKLLKEMKAEAPEEFKAWSQNLGHEKVLTTFLSYGEVAYQRQGEIFRSMAAKPHHTTQTDLREIAEAVSKILNRAGVDV